MKRNYVDSDIFKKKIKLLKGKELVNLFSKIDEILSCEDINHYKNLKHDFKRFKRVHVNNSYIILFFDEKNIVHFVDYAHHDNIYKHSKKNIRKYAFLKF